ncbi:hypothetical protein HOLleu_25659 [Holothuria leucospilota]|uniref:Uncharacterized protein n=1 Tax=Holothuria leucospilota TaxID=206669 RepID=A0A9Q1BSY4_HOLLE|nr:hypothetical protein HOLleu_25659 [Holothuria leucospilota]
MALPGVAEKSIDEDSRSVGADVIFEPWSSGTPDYVDTRSSVQRTIMRVTLFKFSYVSKKKKSPFRFTTLDMTEVQMKYVLQRVNSTLT